MFSGGNVMDNKIEMYKEMVNELKDYYKIVEIEYDDDKQVTGKGYLLKKVK